MAPLTASTSPPSVTLTIFEFCLIQRSPVFTSALAVSNSWLRTWAPRVGVCRIDDSRPPSVPPTGSGLLGASPPADARLQEVVDLAVEHRGRVAGLVLGAQVLDHLVRVQDVGAHLVAPARTAVALQRVQLGLPLVPGPL